MILLEVAVGYDYQNNLGGKLIQPTILWFDNSTISIAVSLCKMLKHWNTQHYLSTIRNNF